MLWLFRSLDQFPSKKYTAQKWSFPWKISLVNVNNSDLLTVTKEILNGKLNFLFSGMFRDSIIYFKNISVQILLIEGFSSCYLFLQSGKFFLNSYTTKILSKTTKLHGKCNYPSFGVLQYTRSSFHHTSEWYYFR